MPTDIRLVEGKSTPGQSLRRVAKPAARSADARSALPAGKALPQRKLNAFAATSRCFVVTHPHRTEVRGIVPVARTR